MVKNLINDRKITERISETNKNARLLVVDDDELIRNVLSNYLESAGYEVNTADNSNEALLKMSSLHYDLALIDIQMPGDNGIVLLEKISEQYPDTAVIMGSGLGEIETAIETMKMGASDYITKPFDMQVLQTRIKQSLEMRRLSIDNLNYRFNLEQLVEKQIYELKKAFCDVNQIYDSTIKTLGSVLDLRDSETEDHCKRVTFYVLKLAWYYGIRDKEQLRELKWGAYLHDIGKIGISDTVLLKPGKLTLAEKKLVETHPAIGYRLLNKIDFLKRSAELVLTHHEAFDGSGYPQGMKGFDIPLNARLFAIADTFDAMTHDRPYRKALSIEDVGRELKRLSGIQFDPELVALFFSIPKEEWSI